MLARAGQLERTAKPDSKLLHHCLLKLSDESDLAQSKIS